MTIDEKSGNLRFCINLKTYDEDDIGDQGSGDFMF